MDCCYNLIKDRLIKVGKYTLLPPQLTRVEILGIASSVYIICLPALTGPNAFAIYAGMDLLQEKLKTIAAEQG